jgi:hypothetical protein
VLFFVFLALLHFPASAAHFELPVTVDDAVSEIDRIRAQDLARMNAMLEGVLLYYSISRQAEKPAPPSVERIREKLLPVDHDDLSLHAASHVQVNHDEQVNIRESTTGTVGGAGAAQSRQELAVTVETPGNAGVIPASKVPSSGETKAAIDYAISPATTVKVDSSRKAGGGSSGAITVEKKIGDATMVEVVGKETKVEDDSTASIGGTMRRQVGKDSVIAVSAEKEKAREVQADTYGASFSTKVAKKTDLELSAHDRVMTEDEITTIALKAQHELSKGIKAGVVIEKTGSERGMESRSSELQVERPVGEAATLKARYGITEENDVQSSVAALNYEMNLRRYVTLFGGFEQHCAAVPSQKAEIGMKTGREGEHFGLTLTGVKEDARLKEFMHRLFLMYVKKF